jgi:MoxR-like ATPase
MDLDFIQQTSQKIIKNVEKVIVGKRPVIEKLLVSLMCKGHVLLEDVPGLGKTMLARSIAKTVNATFKRIQGTPDLLPADIIGVSIYNPDTKRFEFRKGPLFAQILLVDEINRATPKTQSALLEAMGEGQVSIEGMSVSLTQPFFVIATQNPIEFEGTFPLPEAQMDRFFMSLGLGYPDLDEEAEVILRQNKVHPINALEAVVEVTDILKLQNEVPNVYMDASLRQYLLQIVDATRHDPNILLGASPRGSIALYKAAQAYALVNGRDYVIPEDIKTLAVDVLKHRLVLRSETRLKNIDARAIIERILNNIPVPMEQPKNQG